MWRVRLLTFATVAGMVAERTAARMGGREDLRLEARLAFERLFVSAIIRLHEREPLEYGPTPRRLPGRDLAQKALRAGEPLTRANFLKGQAVNGPFGVIARLARDVELVDDDGRLGRNGPALLMAWSEDEQLPALLDEEGPTTRDGAVWMNHVIKVTTASVGKREWPGGHHGIWEDLAHHLRPDRLGPAERRTLLTLLEAQPARRRVLRLLREQRNVYRDALSTGARGAIERAVLLHGLKPRLGDDPLDRLLRDVIVAADAYERTASLLQQAFEGLIWALKQHGGRARPDVLLNDARLHQHLARTGARLGRIIPALDRAIAQLHTQTELRTRPELDPVELIEPLAQLREDAAVSQGPRDLADTVLRRHDQVQRMKRKASWIDRESHWTLMPGETRVDPEAPPVWQDSYLHPFKIPNAYSLLGGLGQVAIQDPDGEEEE
jgi:hypothetical protein